MSCFTVYGISEFSMTANAEAHGIGQRSPLPTLVNMAEDDIAVECFNRWKVDDLRKYIRDRG